MSTVRIREIESTGLDGWDALVRRYDQHRVVHTQSWVESLEAAGCGRPLYLAFEQQGEVVGCMPGLLSSVGGYRLFGSPLAGWQTVSMGPLYDASRVTTVELLAPLIDHLERRHQVSYIEILSRDLDHDAMHAYGFEGRPVPTWRARLHPGDEARTLRGLTENARRNIKRARRLGLVVRIEDDESFVAEHYQQLRQVYRRGGHGIPFGRQRIRACFASMKRSGHLLAISVYLPCGRVCIASGMFLMEGRELLLWTWAHHPRYRWYRATELMTWTAMQHGIAAGCESFDLMGRGDFKKKFGAELDETKMRWLRGRPQWLMRGRDFAEVVLRGKHRVSGQVARLVGRALDPVDWRSNGSRRPEACVMGDVDLVRALGLAGIRAVVVAPPGAPCRFSRSTRACLAWSDPCDQQAELVEALIDYSSLQPEPPVLFYQEDRTLLLLSRNRERLGRAFRFVLPRQELVEQLVDKAKFQKLADCLDLPVPPARTLVPAHEPPPADLEFPLILKPLTRRPEQWEPLAGGGKAARIDSAAALRAFWPDLAAAQVTVLAQALVPGEENRIESYHVYVDEGGNVVAEFTGRKIRTSPRAFGDSTALETTASPDVAELGRDIVRRLNLHGVAKLDFKRGPDDRLHLLEVNPRFTLWHHLGARGGVNIPALVYGDLAGRPRPAVAQARPGVRWCKVWRDRAAARQNDVPLLDWLYWVIGCEAKSALAWDDPMPLLGAGLQRWMARVTRSNGATSGQPDKGGEWHDH